MSTADDPIWIERELATAIHSRQLAEHGGADGIRDSGLLDSALARPRQLFSYGDPTPDIPTLAAGYAFAIAQNHAFLDGNKRTAYVICRTFLLLNGFDIVADKLDRYTGMLSLASGEWDEATFAKWLADHSERAAP